eukprot:11162798-Lingulodinium_polyedra.AAC.1
MLHNDAFNRLPDVATARKSETRALCAHNNFCFAHGTRERAIRNGRPVETAWVLLSGAARALLGNCSGTA